jgi:hypothetical protein
LCRAPCVVCMRACAPVHTCRRTCPQDHTDLNQLELVLCGAAGLVSDPQLRHTHDTLGLRRGVCLPACLPACLSVCLSVCLINGKLSIDEVYRNVRPGNGESAGAGSPRGGLVVVRPTAWHPLLLETACRV